MKAATATATGPLATGHRPRRPKRDPDRDRGPREAEQQRVRDRLPLDEPAEVQEGADESAREQRREEPLVAIPDAKRDAERGDRDGGERSGTDRRVRESGRRTRGHEDCGHDPDDGRTDACTDESNPAD